MILYSKNELNRMCFQTRFLPSGTLIIELFEGDNYLHLVGSIPGPYRDRINAVKQYIDWINQKLESERGGDAIAGILQAIDAIACDEGESS